MSTWAIATVAFVLLAFATASGPLARSVVTPAIFFTAAGLLAGPVLGLIDLEIRGEPVKLLAEATLTLVLFADASRISVRALRNEFAVPAAAARDRTAAHDRRRDARGRRRPAGRQPGRGAGARRSCSPAPTRRSVRRSSPTRASRRASGRDSTSRAASTTASACRCSSSRSPSPRPTTATCPPTPPCTSCSSRSATGWSAGVAAGVLGALALRVCGAAQHVEPHWLQILTFASAVLAAGIALGLGGSIFIAAFSGGFVFGVVGRDSGGEVVVPRRRGRRAAQRRDLHRVRRGHPRPRARRAHLGGRRLRRAQPDRRPDAAGRAVAARQRRTASDGRRSWAGSARADWRRSSSR